MVDIINRRYGYYESWCEQVYIRRDTVEITGRCQVIVRRTTRRASCPNDLVAREGHSKSLPHNTLIGMDFYRRGRIQHHALSWIQLWPVMRQNRVLSHRVWYPFRRDRLSQRHSLDKHRRDHSQLPALLSPAFFCSFCLGVRSGAAGARRRPRRARCVAVCRRALKSALRLLSDKIIVSNVPILP